MTLEEAKKILEKEGFKLGGPGNCKPGVVSEAFVEYEAPEICEAMQIVCSAGFQLAMLAGVFDKRKERLKKEYEKNTKAPDSANNCIKEDSVVINPALKESASQFNDALLDEQAKKIAELTKDKELMKKASLSQLDDFIEIYNLLTKESQKTKRLGKEIAKLNGIIHDKNAILSDVAEELRLTKIREKNLVEVSQKYMKENEELKEQLADKVVGKINANALKSAESALACKEQLIYYKDKIIAYNKKKIAEKNKEIRDLKLQISALEKRGNGIDWKRNADAIKLYVNRASRERLWNPINQDICNEQELSFIINHGGKRVKYALRFDGTDIVYECSDPDKKSRIPTPELSEEELMKLQEKVCVDNAEEGADLSCVIVLCGKDFIDALKKVKDVWQE